MLIDLGNTMPQGQLEGRKEGMKGGGEEGTHFKVILGKRDANIF